MGQRAKARNTVAKTATRAQHSPSRKRAAAVKVDKSPSALRDTQVTKVYRAEKMAQHLFLGKYWTQGMTEIQALDLVEQTLCHPSVVARWGHKSATVAFPDKGAYAWSERDSGHIHLPPDTRNPLTILHEVAHLLPTAEAECQHGPGFAAIYRHLVTLMLGAEAGSTLNAAFEALGVKSSDALLPPIRAGYSLPDGAGIPGVLPGQAGLAAEVIRAAISAGILGEAGSELRSAAFAVARKLKVMDVADEGAHVSSARIPETITIDVADLLGADSRDDVAELVLQNVRESMQPRPLAVASVSSARESGSGQSASRRKARRS